MRQTDMQALMSSFGPAKTAHLQEWLRVCRTAPERARRGKSECVSLQAELGKV